MRITFEKRIYHIEDGEDIYELVEIIKHSLEEYNYRHFCDRVSKYNDSDDPSFSGFGYFEPSEELLKRLHNCINQNKDE